VPPREILTRLVSAKALAGPGTATSILVLDENGLLRNGASVDLPSDYLAAIDGTGNEKQKIMTALPGESSVDGDQTKSKRRKNDGTPGGCRAD
jgi:hypothetical protein